MIGVGRREIEGVIEIDLICACGKTTPQHSSQAGAASDRTGQRAYLQGSYPVGRRPLAVDAKGRDEPTRSHGHKAVSDVVNLGIAQAIGDCAGVVALSILCVCIGKISLGFNEPLVTQRNQKERSKRRSVLHLPSGHSSEVTGIAYQNWDRFYVVILAIQSRRKKGKKQQKTCRYAPVNPTKRTHKLSLSSRREMD